MQEPQFFAAVYGILENKEWKILFLKRKNTGFMDGMYGLPAWHLEWFESLKVWAAREIKEEIWIDVDLDDLELIHNSHRNSWWERIYFDFYYRIHDYSWEISNKEEDKCELLEYLEPDDKRIVPYVREVIWLIWKWEKFSEIISQAKI